MTPLSVAANYDRDFIGNHIDFELTLSATIIQKFCATKTGGKDDGV